MELQDIVDFADWFLEDPINQAILDQDDDTQLRRETWRDAIEYFGGQSISESSFNKMVNVIKHRTKTLT